MSYNLSLKLRVKLILNNILFTERAPSISWNQQWFQPALKYHQLRQTIPQQTTNHQFLPDVHLHHPVITIPLLMLEQIMHSVLRHPQGYRENGLIRIGDKPQKLISLEPTNNHQKEAQQVATAAEVQHPTTWPTWPHLLGLINLLNCNMPTWTETSWVIQEIKFCLQ